MQERFYWHVHERTKALAIARVRDDGVTTFFVDSYPAKDREAALEWLAYFVDGLAGCSMYEWWHLDADTPSDLYESVPRMRVEELRRLVAMTFADIDREKAARTGSP